MRLAARWLHAQEGLLRRMGELPVWPERLFVALGDMAVIADVTQRQPGAAPLSAALNSILLTMVDGLQRQLVIEPMCLPVQVLVWRAMRADGARDPWWPPSELDRFPALEREASLHVAGGDMLAALGSYTRHVAGADAGALDPLQRFAWHEAHDVARGAAFAPSQLPMFYWWTHVLLYASDAGRIQIPARPAAVAAFRRCAELALGAQHVDLAAEGILCLGLLESCAELPGFLQLIESRMTADGRVRGGALEREVEAPCSECFWTSYHRTLLAAAALAVQGAGAPEIGCSGSGAATA